MQGKSAPGGAHSRKLKQQVCVSGQHIAWDIRYTSAGGRHTGVLVNVSQEINNPSVRQILNWRESLPSDSILNRPCVGGAVLQTP